MKNYRYIITAAMLAAAVSCGEKISTDPDSGLGTPIRFSAGIETKAFLGSDDINTANTELTIWGFAGTDALIEGKTATYNATESSWNLDKTYHWGGNKNYTFFSYLTKDKYGKTLTTGTDTNADIDISGITATSGTTVTPGSPRSLKVNSKTFDFATTDNDFDFCYSEVVSRPADNADHSTVAFNLKHLYSAIAFSAHNYTGSSITIKEVTIFGLKNKKSATISFADTGAEVTYPEDDASCTWTSSGKKLNSANITIAKDATIANLVGDGTAAAQHYMFWAQTPAELAATDWKNSSTAPTGGAYVKVVYNQGGSDITKYARFPQDNDGTDDLGWPAGTKRKMELSFRDNMVTLKLKAMPWDYTEPEITYDEKVTADDITPLSFVESTCRVDNSKHTVTFDGGNPIMCTFKVSEPLNATWVISKEGDYDAFEIDNAATSKYGDGKDCNYGTIDGEDCKFTLYPKVSNTGKRYSIQLTFSIRYRDGESDCIDNAIQPTKWTFIFTD